MFFKAWVQDYKQLLLLTVPIIASHAIEALIPFINTILASRLGETSLAGAALAGSTLFTLMGFCWGIISSVGIITANKLGAKAKEEVGLVFWSGMILSLILGIPLLIIFLFMEPVWLWFGQNPDVSRQGQLLLTGFALTVIPDMAKFTIFQFAIACEKPRIPLIANIIGLPLLILCNYALVWGHWGFPALGIFGIGLSSAITYWIVFIGMFIYILRQPFFTRYLFNFWPRKAYTNMVWQQLKLGAPIGLMFTIEIAFFTVLALLMGRISVAALAANQIAIQWFWMIIILAYGVTEGVTILVSKANGMNDYTLIKRYAAMGVILITYIMLGIALIYMFLPEFIIHIDLDPAQSVNTPIIKLAIQFLIIAGIYQILDGMRIVLAGALRGLKDTQYPMWVSVFAFWLIALPVGCVLAYGLKLHGMGLWIGLLLAGIVGVILSYRRLQRKLLFL